MKLPNVEETSLHEFTYKLLSRFVSLFGRQSFATIVFESGTFLVDVRLSFKTELQPHFMALKQLDHDTMKRFEMSCTKLILKLFHVSECIFIEKIKGSFEQQALLYGSSHEFSDLFVGIIDKHVVRISVYRALREYFLSSLKSLLTRKKQVWKQVVLTKEQAAHEVQMFGGWALHGLQSVDKSNTLKHWAIRQMYDISQDVSYDDDRYTQTYATITRILNQGGLKILKPPLFKWADAILKHIRCFINENSIMFYRAKVLHNAKKDLEEHCELTYNGMFAYAWGIIFKDDLKMYTNVELTVIVYTFFYQK